MWITHRANAIHNSRAYVSCTNTWYLRLVEVQLEVDWAPAHIYSYIYIYIYIYSIARLIRWWSAGKCSRTPHVCNPIPIEEVRLHSLHSAQSEDEERADTHSPRAIVCTGTHHKYVQSLSRGKTFWLRHEHMTVNSCLSSVLLRMST